MTQTRKIEPLYLEKHAAETFHLIGGWGMGFKGLFRVLGGGSLKDKTGNVAQLAT